MKALFGQRPQIFFVCLAVWTLTNMDQALFGYAVPGILAEFKLSLDAIGLILTISFAVAAVMAAGAGIAADRWDRGQVLCILLTASAICVGLQGFAGGIAALTLFRTLGFGFSAGLSPITNALVVENAPSKYRGVAMGLLQCGYPLGWFLASFGAAPLLGAYGWRSICFIAFAVLPLLWPIALITHGTRRVETPAVVSPEVAAGSTWATLWSPPLRQRSAIIAAIFFSFGGAYSGSAFFFPTFFTQARGYSPADATSLVGLSNGIALFGYVGAALIGEFILSRRTVFVGWCLGGAAALVGLLWLSSSRTQDLIWYGLTATFFFGSQAVVAVLVADLYPARVRASALAICASAPLSLGFAIFPLLVPSVISAAGWSAGLTIVVVPLLCATGFLALLLPKQSKVAAAADG